MANLGACVCVSIANFNILHLTSPGDYHKLRVTHKINQHTAKHTLSIWARAFACTRTKLICTHFMMYFTLADCKNYLNCIYENIWMQSLTMKRWREKEHTKTECNMENGSKHCLVYSNHKYFYINYTEIYEHFILWSELTRLSNHSAHVYSIELIKFSYSNNLKNNFSSLLLLLFYKYT